MAAYRFLKLAFASALWCWTSCAEYNLEFSMPGDCDKRNDASARLYCIKVKAKKLDSNWQVWHRYTDFSVLRDRLGEKALFDDVPFPSKFRLPCFGSVECRNTRTVTRRDELRAWLQKVLDQATSDEWQKALSDFFSQDSKIEENYMAAAKSLAKQKHAEIVKAWTGTRVVLAEKIKDFKAKMGFGADELGRKMEDVDERVQELNKIMSSGSEKAITDAFSEASYKIEELFSEQAKAEDAFGEELFYQCGEEDSEDCKREYEHALNRGVIKDFCVRCATEKSEDPLRHRCNTCCSKCGGHAYKCGPAANDGDDCKRAFANAEKNNDLASLCNRCASEGGDFLIRIRCSLCCSKCQDDFAALPEL